MRQPAELFAAEAEGQPYAVGPAASRDLQPGGQPRAVLLLALLAGLILTLGFLAAVMLLVAR